MEKEIQLSHPDSIARSRRTSKEMFPLVEQWLDSRENQKDFCTFHRLPLAVFSYWLKKYRNHDIEKPAEAGTKFAALSVRQELSCGPVIDFPDGVKIRLSPHTPTSYLRELAGQC